MRITGPETFSGVTDSRGSFDEENVERGNYTVTTGGDGGTPQRQTRCEKPPRPSPYPATAISEALVQLESPSSSVDCGKPQQLRVGGELKGESRSGTVRYVWTSSTGKRTEAAVNYYGYSETVEDFTVTVPPRARPQDPAPRVSIQLSVPKQGLQPAISSDLTSFTLRCS